MVRVGRETVPFGLMVSEQIFCNVLEKRVGKCRETECVCDEAVSNGQRDGGGQAKETTKVA